MSKLITDTEMAGIITQAIADFSHAPWANSHLSADLAYQAFIEDLGRVIAQHFGGRFKRVGVPDGIEALGHTVSFGWDRRIPKSGGVYACVDTDVAINAWENDRPKISALGQLL